MSDDTFSEDVEAMTQRIWSVLWPIFQGQRTLVAATALTQVLFIAVMSGNKDSAQETLIGAAQGLIAAANALGTEKFLTQWKPDGLNS
jgi:hypothetical protein